ncbi:tail fiber assembly protein [Parasutterella excrementihominis]|uniref:tail fiber assembly protein n=1 Tax=Parasutterella excrementihominis TaxID=487175 RepID=UPI0024328A1F|nr:tail fiber assembly protein [Parasutterella excrementihominis]
MTTPKNVENSVKTVFAYDEDGYFSDTHIAQINPKNPTQWLMPARVTTVKPELKPKFFYKIKDETSVDSGWDAVPYPASAADFVGVQIPHQSRTMHNNILRALLTSFVQADPEHYREIAVNDKDGNKIATTVEKIPEPTPEEIKERKAAEVRAQRDYLLNKTDYLVSGDYPISAEDLAKVKAYRQALRDLPEQEGFPESVEWPTEPKVKVIRE